MTKPVHIINNRTNPLNIYSELVTQAGLFGKAFYGEKCTAYQNAKLRKLWNAALDTACGIATINEQGETFITSVESPIPYPHGYKRIPAIVGIIWHNPDDPTQNEVTFDMRRATHFQFNPADDLALLFDYRQEIAALLFT